MSLGSTNFKHVSSCNSSLNSNQQPLNTPELLSVNVDVLILQQLTLDKVVSQAELRHGQYLSFVGWGVAGGAHHVIPVFTTGAALAAHTAGG